MTITRRALSLKSVRSARAIALFTSFGHEVATHDLIGELIALTGWVALPRVEKAQGRLALYRVEDFPRDMIPGPYGILEPDPTQYSTMNPSDLDLVFVPGVLFNHEGYRIGYGAGYYDRLLATLSPEARTIGLAFGMQVVEAPLPTDPWDLPVDSICTETALINTRNTRSRRLNPPRY
jgi:5-formyltetrahydrofolate cyclo-ligase